MCARSLNVFVCAVCFGETGEERRNEDNTEGRNNSGVVVLNSTAAAML